MLKYNLKVSLSWIIGRIGQSIDKVMLIGLVSNANFAIYSLGCIQLPLLSIFYNSIGDVTLTKISLLSSENKKQLWIPPGFAHGFLTLKKENIICYSLTEYRSPKTERSLKYNDPKLKIKWPSKKPNISKKDKNASNFELLIR